MRKFVFISTVFFFFVLSLLISRPSLARDCTARGGECRRILHNICPDGFDPTPIDGYGELGCKTGEVCCQPLPLGCYSRSPLVGCEAGETRCPSAPITCCSNVSDCPVFRPGWTPRQKIYCDESGNQTNDPFTGKLFTAIGCIPVLGDNGQNEFMGFILKWAVGVGGGIAFLLIVYAGFLIMTSSGNPERLKGGQELLTSAISGIILLILSVFILKVVGVNILGIPGFIKP